MGGLGRAISALVSVRPRARLAESVAAQLRARLPDDYVVLPRYAPRDNGSDEVALVVCGPHGVLVVEPRDDAGDLVCYQDHWYERGTAGISRPLRDSPSQRARWNATRVKGDLASGGAIYAPVEAVVLLTRGRPSDVGSSCVPVLAGSDELVEHVLRQTRPDGSAERTRAFVEALAGPIRVAVA